MAGGGLAGEVGGTFGGVVDVEDGGAVLVAFAAFALAGAGFVGVAGDDDEEGGAAALEEAVDPGFFGGVLAFAAFGDVGFEAGFGVGAFADVFDAAAGGVDEVVDGVGGGAHGVGLVVFASFAVLGAVGLALALVWRGVGWVFIGGF